MSVKVNSNACPQNHRCPLVFYCPANAITQNGFGLPVIDEEKCTNCGKCVKMCPTRALSFDKNKLVVN
jgi:Fe-S-cluster-containing hydrogenase component 2